MYMVRNTKTGFLMKWQISSYLNHKDSRIKKAMLLLLFLVTNGAERCIFVNNFWHKNLLFLFKKALKHTPHEELTKICKNTLYMFLWLTKETTHALIKGNQKCFSTIGKQI